MKHQIFSIVDRLAKIHDDSADGENENDEPEAENQQDLLWYDDLFILLIN